jgi:D-apionate oxidoisomerase
MTDSTTSTGQLTIAVIGAGGKIGMRVSDNLQRSTHAVYYSDNSPAGQQRTRDGGREVTDTPTAVADAHVVIIAVPDVALGPVSAEVVPQLKPGMLLLTLDPAAAYANLNRREGDPAHVRAGDRRALGDGQAAGLPRAHLGRGRGLHDR